MNLLTITNRIKAAIKKGEVSIEGRIELSEALTFALDAEIEAHQVKVAEIEALFHKLRSIEDAPPEVEADKHLQAADILSKLVDELDMTTDQGLTFWVKTQNVDKSLKAKVTPGEGVYSVTGLKAGSQLKTVLARLNELGDKWTVKDGKFIKAG